MLTATAPKPGRNENSPAIVPGTCRSHRRSKVKSSILTPSTVARVSRSMSIGASTPQIDRSHPILDALPNTREISGITVGEVTCESCWCASVSTVFFPN